jgi:hypothetical protein
MMILESQSIWLTSEMLMRDVSLALSLWLIPPPFTLIIRDSY